MLNQQDGSRNMHGLAADESNSILYSIDQDNGRLLAFAPDGGISEVGGAGTHGRGMAFNSRDGFIYDSFDRVDPDGKTRQHIFRIDPSTGAASDVGSIGLLTLHGNIGLAYDPVLDRLLMTVRPLYDDGSFGPSNLYSINPTTATASLIGSTGVTEIDALAFVPDPNPIPEPASLIVWSALGALTITVGWWRRRR